jgi:hypothetical protein
MGSSLMLNLKPSGAKYQRLQTAETSIDDVTSTVDTSDKAPILDRQSAVERQPKKKSVFMHLVTDKSVVLVIAIYSVVSFGVIGFDGMDDATRVIETVQRYN